MKTISSLRLKTGLLTAGAALLIPLGALAMGPHHGDGPCGGGFGPPMMGGDAMERGMHPPPFLRSLNLTDAQRDTIFKLMQEQAPAMREKAKEARAIHQELHALVFSDKYDEAKVKALTDKGTQIMAEMAARHAATSHQIYMLLTPEQRKKAEALKADWESQGPRSGDGPSRRR